MNTVRKASNVWAVEGQVDPLCTQTGKQTHRKCCSCPALLLWGEHASSTFLVVYIKERGRTTEVCVCVRVHMNVH
jgi:hypothetical protein